MVSKKMNYSSNAACLKDAFDGVFELALPLSNLRSGMTIADWVMEQEINGWSIGRDMRCIGFTHAGYLAARYLVKRLRSNNCICRRVVNAATLTSYVLDQIRTTWMRCQGLSTTILNIDDFERQLLKWINSFKGERIHLIPCSILDGAAETFFAGSIMFVHVDNFDPSKYNIEDWDRASAALRRCMERDDAKWISVVRVNDCEPSRSEEIAELTVDLALGALQTILVDFHATNIARITGRALPSHKGSLMVQAGGHWSARSTPMHPGLTLLPDAFNEAIKRSEGLLAQMGRRVDAYRRGNAKCGVLEQSWCDAVFWFHEGFSEPIDAVAIVKMEIAIENLFAAGGTAKTKARLLRAFERLLSLKKNSLIDTRLPVTVGQFVSAVVTVRSRILHGTWSTLGGDDFDVERPDVAKLARTFLLIYAQFLDLYIDSAISPADDVSAFFDWVEERPWRQRTKSHSS